MSVDKELKEKELINANGGNELEPEFNCLFCPKCRIIFNTEEELRTHQMSCFSSNDYVNSNH